MTTKTVFDLKFLCAFSNNRYPGKLDSTSFSSKKISTVIFIEG